MPSAEAIAHGAATVVNAISTGRGAAFGVGLWTKAEVELNRDVGEITAHIQDEHDEPCDLMIHAVRKVLRRYGVHRTFGARVTTRSNIPIARGMKSSSVAANAVTLATTAALGKRATDECIIKDSVESAIRARVTITGAFDDACSSYYGGLVVTDNTRMIILKRRRISEGYRVLFHVPLEKSYTANVDMDKFRKLAHISELAHGLALNGHHWEALIVNGLAHSVALGWNPRVAIEAMAAGATASGLSGKGPATVAVVKRHLLSRVRSALSEFEGDIIETVPNNRRATVIARHA